MLSFVLSAKGQRLVWKGGKEARSKGMKESQVAAHGLFLKASNQTGAPETRDRSNSALSDSFQTVPDLVLEGLQPSEICGLKMVKRQVVAGVVLITSSSSRLPRRRSRSCTSFFFSQALGVREMQDPQRHTATPRWKQKQFYTQTNSVVHIFLVCPDATTIFRHAFCNSLLVTSRCLRPSFSFTFL